MLQSDSLEAGVLANKVTGLGYPFLSSPPPPVAMDVGGLLASLPLPHFITLSIPKPTVGSDDA